MIPGLTKADAWNYSALQLAYIGDSVYSLQMRLYALGKGIGPRLMHAITTGMVSAVAQAKALETIYDALSQEEKEIAKRGRNAHARHQAPKSASVAEYSSSTGLEALIGFLYLTGQSGRIDTLIETIVKDTFEKDSNA